MALERAILQAPEVVVEGGLMRQRLDRLAASVTVVDGDRSRASGAGHLQDATHAVPNLNWAGGTSRPRYFQIRGMGERSHYAGEGPPSFSVGFVMDDVDLSGMGMAGLLFDVDQVEVFKGPQSTIFGPNALAGLINLRSADPQPGLAGAGSAEMGSDGLGRFSGAVNLPVGSELALRVGYENGRSNGFRSNAFLDADDTNGRREQLVRAKVGWTPAAGPEVLGTFFWADADNGYDAWVPDNNEDLTTYSDKPGKDRQQTTGASLKSTWGLGASGAELVAITAFSRSELEHSYDGDWGNDEYWLAEHGFDPAVEGWSYDFFDRNVRDRTVVSQEARLLVEELVVGAYWKRLEEEDNAAGYLFGGDATDLNGTLRDRQPSFFTVSTGWPWAKSCGWKSMRGSTATIRLMRGRRRITGPIAPALRLLSINGWAVAKQPSVTTGVRAKPCTLRPRAATALAGSTSIRYLAAENRPYDPEYIVNFELGWRAGGPRYSTGITLFHALRSDQQVRVVEPAGSG